MASKLSDINDLYVCTGNTQPSGAVITSVTGVPVDMATCANNNNFAILNIGTVAGTEITFSAKIQESPNTTSPGVFLNPCLRAKERLNRANQLSSIESRTRSRSSAAPSGPRNGSVIQNIRSGSRLGRRAEAPWRISL